MSWDYRVVHRREVFPGVIGAEDVYAIHEVFYNDQNRPNGVSASPAPVQAGTLAGLISAEEERVCSWCSASGGWPCPICAKTESPR